jgi:hypothetical protein
MTPQEGFKFGFLFRCAEEGLSLDETQQRAVAVLEKRGGIFWSPGAARLALAASEKRGGALDLAAQAPGALWSLGTKGLMLGGLGIAGAGGLGGYALAKMREGDVDPAEIRRQELIDTYNTQAELARRKAIMAAARSAQPRPRSRHGI